MSSQNSDGSGGDGDAGETLTAGVAIAATAASGDTLTAGVAIATNDATAATVASGKINSRRLRYMVISISVFISLNVQHNNQDDESQSTPSPDELGDGRSSSEPISCHHVIDVLPNDAAVEAERGESEWDRVVRIVKDRDSIALRRLGGVDRVVSLQRSNFERTEDDVIDGVEAPQEHLKASNKGRGFLYFLSQAFNSYTIVLLCISALLLFAIEVIEQGPQDGWHDGVAVVFAIFLLVSFSSLGNFHRERKLAKKLLKERKKMKVNVERNGKSLNVDVGHIKVWDTVHLKQGDQIPAEGLFLGGENLKLDEAHSSKIDRDRNPFLGLGSKVKEGHGSMIVTSLGSHANLLQPSLHGFGKDTLLQSLMDKPYKYIDKLALSMSVLIAFTALIRLLFKKRDGFDGLPEMKGHLTMKLLMEMFERIILKPQGRVSILASALVTLVVGVQHGMPFVFGVCLSYWTNKLSNDQVILHNISAGCTMGLVTVVIVDVTHGDLLPEVKEFWMGENEIIGDKELTVPDSILHRGIDVWELHFVPKFSMGQTHHVLGSEEKSQVIEYRRTSSSGKRGCEALLRQVGDEEQTLHLHWKGPPLTILKMCSHFYSCGGEIHAIECDQKRAFAKLIKDMENNGLCPIAFAYHQTDVRELKKDGLILLAILGLKYPCRGDVKLVVNAFRSKSGPIIKLASEDELPMVKSIAWELGFLRPDSNDIGAEAVKGDLSESNVPLDQITVIGNSQPEDKFQMVEKLQGNGHVVAFVGGLTARDTLTLVKADVGIVQEGRCSESANKSSDILLKSRPAESLAQITACGRCIYRNIQTFIQLQLTAWISGLTITLVSTMHSGESPLTSVQMMYVSLVLCLLGGLMMAMEFKSTDNQPAKRTQPLVTIATWRNIVIQACYQVCVLLIFQFFIGTKYASTKAEKNILKTVIFNTFTLCQIFNLLNAIELAKKEVLVVVCCSCWFLVALVTILCFQVLGVQFGDGLLCSEKLSVKLWTFCFLLTALSQLFDSAMKLLISWLPESYSLAWSSRTSNCKSKFYYLALPFSMLFLFSTSHYFRIDVVNNIC